MNFKSAFNLLRKNPKAALNIKKFINLVTFNYLILNNDAHGKNYSLLYKENGEIELASAYDILCTKAYSKLTHRMAMEIGGCYISGNVTPEHFKRFANEIDISYSQLNKIIKSQCESIPEILKEVSESFENKIGKTIFEFVSKHCLKNLKLFKR